MVFQQEARKQNHEQVVEEDRKSKLPVNFESKKARQEWELEEIEAKKVSHFFNHLCWLNIFFTLCIAWF